LTLHTDTICFLFTYLRPQDSCLVDKNITRCQADFFGYRNGVERKNHGSTPTEGLQLTEDTINVIYIFFFSLAEIID